jgi:hypothetical protein
MQEGLERHKRCVYASVERRRGERCDAKSAGYELWCARVSLVVVPASWLSLTYGILEIYGENGRAYVCVTVMCL